jgi:4-hydroxyphenylpyruvate dioxygenase
MQIDHIHFYVENAAQTRDWLIQKMGFQSSGQQVNEHTSTEIVVNGAVVLRVSSAVNQDGPVAQYLAVHPAGVADVAFVVDDLATFSQKIADLDLQVIAEDRRVAGQVEQITIQGWGDFQHTLIARESEQRSISSELLQNNSSSPGQVDQLISIDHVVLNVGQHQLAAATAWYQNLFDWRVQQSFDIQTDYSGLYSQALVDATGQVQFNINEPSVSTSQIQTFLDVHGGAGIQHVALRTDNIFDAVAHLRRQNLEFLAIPKSYYINLHQRSRSVSGFLLNSPEWQALEKLEILLDWSASGAPGLLMQIFTQPIFAKPTFFFEIIERRGQKKGFGEGNFKALFQAIEQEEFNRIST